MEKNKNYYDDMKKFLDLSRGVFGNKPTVKKGRINEDFNDDDPINVFGDDDSDVATDNFGDQEMSNSSIDQDGGLNMGDEGGEDSENQNPSDDVRELTEPERQMEEKEFKKSVSPQVKFGKFEIYPDAGNIEWRGELLAERIRWYYSLDDTTGCYVAFDSPLQLRDDTLDTMNKLRGYYDIWREQWADKISGGGPSEKDEFNGDDMGNDQFGEQGSQDQFGDQGGQDQFGGDMNNDEFNQGF